MRVKIIGGVGKGGATAIRADAGIERGGATGIVANVMGNAESSESDTSESSDSISTSVGSYFLLCTSLSFIPSVSLAALMTRELLAWANC